MELFLLTWFNKIHFNLVQVYLSIIMQQLIFNNEDVHGQEGETVQHEDTGVQQTEGRWQNVQSLLVKQGGDRTN